MLDPNNESRRPEEIETKYGIVFPASRIGAGNTNICHMCNTQF